MPCPDGHSDWHALAEAGSVKAQAGQVDPFLILLVVVVVMALAVGALIHHLLELRRSKRDRLADLQSKAIAIIKPNE